MSDEIYVTERGSLAIRLFSPPSTASPLKLAVFTHPWAPLGGNMHDPVLRILRDVFLKEDFYVLIYNSRPSFTGHGEAQDLQELVKGTIAKLGGDIQHLVLLGYSHGSLIASMHPLLPSPSKTSHILISYPLSVRGLITFFRGGTYDAALRDLLQNPSSQVFIAYGDQDQFTAVQKYNKWASDLKKDVKGQLVTRRIDGSDHFWSGPGGSELCQAVATWISAQNGSATNT
ncbi:hypothetical protein M422DRAFT_26916 [Sphaerobolus stellatus SS14]|nr:hypothetical protein M422DRAFT_26916 [Sphaerobolus stellatus SS14]